MASIYYSCHLSEAAVLIEDFPDLETAADGCVLYFSIQTRFARMNDSGLLQSITEDPNPRENLISMPLSTVLPGTRNALSLVLNHVEIPAAEHGKLVSRISEFAAHMESDPIVDDDPLMVKSIKIEIGIWNTVNIAPANHIPAENEPARDDECTICFEVPSVELEVAELACGHRYHLHCILEWISFNQVCPTCRFEVPVEIEG